MKSKNLIFIFGCQRSGTTITLRILGRVNGVKAFKETGENIHKISRRGVNIRLKKPAKLSNIFEEQKESTVVIKPLVESQNARVLLEYFESAVGIWLFRDYRDVAASMLQLWSSKVGFNALEAIRKGNMRNWRGQHATPEMQVLATDLLKNAKLTPADAAAMHWYFRNLHFFNQNLSEHNRIRLINYKELIEHSGHLQKVLDNLGIKLELEDQFFNAKSIGKGSSIKLLPEVNALCESMMTDLDHIVENQRINAS